MAKNDGAPRRCAIYTRKSSEEGLEQNFNSLRAQRQACEAYVKSQAGEAWRLVKTEFDDGGFSGATMDRPALKALLDHIKEKRIDVVVVYKVDRLTRSLADFAKIVEIFDAEGVSFVAVTQQFNTTTSMGRLTLNVLLSFAQFEREVTGERIRDKIAASKQKGMWMGGSVPLGYDLSDHRLVVNAAEAETVRLIFQLYLERKTLSGQRGAGPQVDCLKAMGVERRCTARRIPVRSRCALSPSGEPDLCGRDPTQESSLSGSARTDNRASHMAASPANAQ
jgi:site-specific DNA recombinase